MQTMKPVKRSCPACGAPLNTKQGRAVCDYCGMEIELVKDVDQHKMEISPARNISSPEPETGGERRVSLIHELSQMQTLLSNLRTEKRELLSSKDEGIYKEDLLQNFKKEEDDLLSRIETIQNELARDGDLHNVPDPYTQSGKDFKPRTQLSVLLLCYFLGCFGVHRFYTGYKKLGIFYLLTAGGFGIGILVDLILLYTNTYKDKLNRELIPMNNLTRTITYALTLGLIIYTLISIKVESLSFYIWVIIAFCIAFLMNIRKLTLIMRQMLRKGN